MTISETKRDGQERQIARCGFVKSGEIVAWVEKHLECWRQISHYISVARDKKFDKAAEDLFLELKGVIVREFEMILASGECDRVSKEDVHEMMNNVPSLRYISQLNACALNKVEHQWHLIYIGWHAILGHLKVKYK